MSTTSKFENESASSSTATLLDFQSIPSKKSRMRDADTESKNEGTSFNKSNNLTIDIFSQDDNDSITPLPSQRTWPPSVLGIIPLAQNAILNIVNVDHISRCKSSDEYSTDCAVIHSHKDSLLQIWSADIHTVANASFLTLPREDKTGKASRWGDDSHSSYPSHQIYIRQSYEKAASIFFHYAATQDDDMRQMLLGGTSGIGKTFFARYFVWRLLHPDGIEVMKIPRTILCRIGSNWCMYHAGHFYLVTHVEDILCSAAGKNLLDCSDAWVISDGSPPPSYAHCNTLVISSPGNLQTDEYKGSKRYQKGRPCTAYLPTWSPEEIMIVANIIYGREISDESDLVSRYRRYGGIPRSIYQYDDNEDPLLQSLSGTDVQYALHEAGSSVVDHRKISGAILHLIPDDTLRKCSFQWGSTEIMMTAFGQLFKITKSKIQCFLHAGMGLHLGTFYGLLLEPYFHSLVTEGGYSGRMRLLNTGSSDILNTKRNALGIKVSSYSTNKHSIPRLEYHQFHRLDEIIHNHYNVPDRKNFAAIDSLAPSLGEMYQVTSAERHPIKANQLLLLKKYFNNLIAAGGKVKLIFIVPPNRFDDFGPQSYTVTESKAEASEAKTTKGEGDKPIGTSSSTVTSVQHSLAQSKPQDAAHITRKPASIRGKVTRRDSTLSLRTKSLPKVAQSSIQKSEKTDPTADASDGIVFDWIDQYVMEVDVSPMTNTFDKYAEEEFKKRNIAEGLAGGLKKGLKIAI